MCEQEKQDHTTTRAYGHIYSELEKRGITVKRGPKALLIRDDSDAVVIDSEMRPPSLRLVGNRTIIAIGVAELKPTNGSMAIDAFDLVSELVYKFYGDLR